MTTVRITEGTSDQVVRDVIEDAFPQALAKAEARCMSTYRGIVLDTEEAG